MPRHEIKRGDTREHAATLREGDGSAAALSTPGTTCTLHVKHSVPGTSTTKHVTCEILDVGNDTRGRVSFVFPTGFWDALGVWYGEFEVVYVGGAEQTYPVAGYEEFEVFGDLG